MSDLLLDQLGYASVDVLGLSWGGFLAQKKTRRYSRRVNKLVLALTSAGGMTMTQGSPKVILEMNFPRHYFSRAYRDKILPVLYGGRTKSQPELVIAHAERNISPPLYGYYSQLLVSGLWTSLHWPHTIQQPTLVISAENDPLIPKINQ
ncbi:MAG: alpha/beta fold hydrolase [Pseudomonadales bacterium]